MVRRFTRKPIQAMSQVRKKSTPTTRPARHANDRLRKIVEGMRIRPSDHVLEIGCGHGVAATLICEKLTTGRLVAIDRSKKLIDAATLRNRRFIDAGIAEFHVADALSFDPGRRCFDKILAVRVALFYRDAAAAQARAHIQRWLKRGGKMVLVYDEP